MKSTFDKNAEKFVNLMVEKIESLSMNWQKPWFSKVNSKQNFLPQNLTGRTYSGGNAFLLYFLCEKYNYQTPVFLTFNQATPVDPPAQWFSPPSPKKMDFQPAI